MKVMVGLFTTESNANVPIPCDLKSYDIGFGDECIRKMRIAHYFKEEGIEMIPSIYASSGAAGVISKNTFTYIESVFINTLKRHLHELDGIYLHLHGASEVEDLGSGDHHILNEIRKITGPYLPIAVVCDPHGNLCKDYVEQTTILRSYRESPHTDAEQTKEVVARMLGDLLRKRQAIHSIYRKLPLILGGEQSVSTDEPVCSINRYMDELELDQRIMSVSWHVGYIRHDCDVAGCGIVVVPSTSKDQTYAEQIADQLATYIWDKRHEFHYTGITAQPEEALNMAIEHNESPVFITDSGDNTTSGATGWNTYILRQVLKCKHTKKSFLFSNICDPISYDKLADLVIGEKTSIVLGMNYDELSKSVGLDVIVKSKGELRGYLVHDHQAVFGRCVCVSIVGTNIDVVVASSRTTMCEYHQFVAANLDWDAYDVIVVKQGYAFPEILEKGKLCVMSLTNGATPQDTASIPFKRIMRPMYPIDNI